MQQQTFNYYLVALAAAIVLMMVSSVKAGEDEQDLLKALRMPGHPFIRHTTRFSTVSQTVTQTLVVGGGACARLVNVTGPCHLRRRSSHNEDDHDQHPVVLTFDQDDDDDDSLIRLFTKPTPVLRMESTQEPAESASPPSSFVLEASMQDSNEEENRFKLFKKPVFNAVVVKVTTVHITSTVIQTLSPTRTVFIMNCTPVPFTYPLCNKHPNKAAVS